MTEYISPLHSKAKIQCCLEALKNPPPLTKFKVPLPSALLMGVEQIILKSSTTTRTTTLLPTMTSTSVSSMTVTPASVITTSTGATTSTANTEPRLVITTIPILGALPPASGVLQAEPQLPSQASTLPNYIHFCTTNSPHSIMLATLHYPPRIDLNVEFFSPCTLHEMVLINFFSRLGTCITMALHVHATNALLSIYQYFPHKLLPNLTTATLILQWVVGILAEELSCINTVQTTHFALFL
uniref:Uncharacterized protein n=1 Tax=Romanomermis culicivorax TaxID=13658 RepID=A0A915INT4_ROMCU